MQTRTFAGQLLRLSFAFSLFLATLAPGHLSHAYDMRFEALAGVEQQVPTDIAVEYRPTSTRGLWFVLLLLILASDLVVILIRRRKLTLVKTDNDGSGTAGSADTGSLEAERANARRTLCEQYRVILEALPDSVLLLTTDQKIFWSNAAAGTSLGMEPAELIGRFCNEVWHHRIGDGICCPGRKCLSTGMPEMSQGWSRDQRMFDIRAVPLRDPGGVIVCVVEMGRESTDLHRLETQLRQSQKMELIGQLAGGIAHDFNNLLTAIMGFGYILQMKLPEHGTERAHLSRIISAAERAAVLTESLLSFGRKHATAMVPADLNLIVREMEDILSRLLGEDIEIRFTLSDEALPVLADKVLLGQVLLNISTNARDAMPRGGELEIRTFAGIPVSEGKEPVPDGFVLLEIEDSGTGMDAGTVARVFEPFFTTKEDGKGTGLGLTMAQGIVSQHGGYMKIASEPGKGTTFRVFLPRHAGEMAELLRQPSPSPSRGNAVVLLVEDDSHTRDFISELLSGYGYRVIEARDGSEAVERFLERPDEITLLICDLVGPEKNGRQIYDELLGCRPDLKALFISGYPLETLRKKGICTGDVPILSKPFDPPEFLARVRSLLD